MIGVGRLLHGRDEQPRDLGRLRGRQPLAQAFQGCQTKSFLYESQSIWDPLCWEKILDLSLELPEGEEFNKVIAASGFETTTQIRFPKEAPEDCLLRPLVIGCSALKLE